MQHGFDFQMPYLRAYFGNLGIRETDMRIVRAEMTIAGLVPRLARFEEMAADSLAAADEAIRETANLPHRKAPAGGV